MGWCWRTHTSPLALAQEHREKVQGLAEGRTPAGDQEVLQTQKGDHVTSTWGLGRMEGLRGSPGLI